MTLDKATAFRNYQDFLAKIDATFAGIQARYPQDFHCRQGCHSCCKPQLTVNALEAAAIRAALEANPALATACLENEKAAPHGKKRCAFLDAGGACLIYTFRPVVCRSHGAPIQYQPEKGKKSKQDAEEKRMRDVCVLNFTTGNVLQLPLTDVLNLDTINTLLEILNKAFASEKRTTLAPSTLLDRTIV